MGYIQYVGCHMHGDERGSEKEKVILGKCLYIYLAIINRHSGHLNACSDTLITREIFEK